MLYGFISERKKTGAFGNEQGEGSGHQAFREVSHQRRSVRCLDGSACSIFTRVRCAARFSFTPQFPASAAPKSYDKAKGFGLTARAAAGSSFSPKFVHSQWYENRPATSQTRVSDPLRGGRPQPVYRWGYHHPRIFHHTIPTTVQIRIFGAVAIRPSCHHFCCETYPAPK